MNDQVGLRDSSLAYSSPTPIAAAVRGSGVYWRTQGGTDSAQVDGWAVGADVTFANFTLGGAYGEAPAVVHREIRAQRAAARRTIRAMVGERILGSATHALQAGGVHSCLYFRCGGLTRSKGILASGSDVGGLVASISILDPILCRAVSPWPVTIGNELSKMCPLTDGMTVTSFSGFTRVAIAQATSCGS